MSDIKTSQAKGMFEASVLSNKRIKQHLYKLKLSFSSDGAKAFANCNAGQFAEFDVSGIPLPPQGKIPSDLLDTSSRDVLLRRPFSFTDVSIHGDKTHVDILYCVLGPATVRMTTLTAGQSINVIGPLGNGFHIPENKKYAFLVSGGMGIPPLQHLAKNLTTNYPDIEVMAFAGAKTKYDLPVEGKLDEMSQQLGFSIGEFAHFGLESQIATDDGSYGYNGFVTDCFLEWLDKLEFSANEAIIYSCGPEIMLSKIANIARERNIDCQVSMERRMACGFGICQGCAIECKQNNSNETVYKMCCQDGPVFNSREIIFSD